MMSLHKSLSAVLFSCAVLAVPAARGAEAFPQRPITLIVPFSAGGTFDLVARWAAEKAGAGLGQTMIVENKPGAGGTLGGRMVSQAKPDGYTLLLSGVGPISISPAVYSNLGYDPGKALAPVIQLTSSPLVLATSLEFKGASVGDFVEFLKQKPDAYNYASTGNGTVVHLAGEYFKQSTGTSFEHIPYSGGSQATLSLLKGDANFSITNIPNVLEQIKSGKLKGLATTGRHRSPALADLPTMDEAGLKGFDVTGWIGIFAPAGTPPAVLDKLNAAFAQAMRDPQIKQRLEQQGDNIATGPVADFQNFVAESNVKWARIARQAHVSID